MKTLLQVGAGKIGRSFIAQIFSKAGYRIVFADIDPCIVNSLNKASSYKVIFKKNNSTEIYTVEHVSALEISATEKFTDCIVHADIIAISVGRKSLLNVAWLLSEGIKKRYKERPEKPIDIILAENVADAAFLLSNEMEKFLTDLPFRTYVGFVETSIGKMVPLMTLEQLNKDPLAVYAEPYNRLIVDKSAFKGDIPLVEDLSPKENMKAWVDRKMFVHNLGQAVLAYQCNYNYPKIIYTWEALQKKEIEEITRTTMLQSARVLLAMYPSEFTLIQLENHVEELIVRYKNEALGHTIFMAGCDLPRKLGRDDRLMKPILQAIELGMNYDLILESWIKGCFFGARNEKGQAFPEDKKIHEKYRRNPIWILSAHCNLDSTKYDFVFRKVEKFLKKMEAND